MAEARLWLFGVVMSVGVLSWHVADATPRIEAWESDNGARVLYVEARELPILDIRVIFDAGSARDGDLPGLASLANGLLLDGAGDWSADEIADRLERVGSEIGNGALRDMAWVSLRTLTEERSLETSVDTLAAILADPVFDARGVERDRQAMLVNLKLEAQNPGKIASRRFYETLYGDHPYGIRTEGTESSLAKITREEVLEHHRRFYVARNAVIVMVGNVDRSAAERISNRLTAGMAGGAPAPDLPTVPPRAARELIDEQFPSAQSHIMMGQPGVRRGDPDYFPLVVGNHLLGGNGLVSILSEEVREKRGLSYSVYSYFSPMRQQGPFVVGAQTQNARKEEALAVLRETLRKFVTEGPDGAALDAAKKNITGGFPLEIASNKKIAAYLGMIGFYGLPLDYLDTYVQRVNAVSVDDVRQAFQRRIDPESFLTVVVGNGQASGKAE